MVACGAVHTPMLLRRNRLGAISGELGRNLAIHPCTAVRAVFDEDVGMADGVPQSYYVDEFASEGIMFEGAAGPPDYMAAGLPVSGDRLRELMLRFGQMSQFGVMISDRSRGEVKEVAGRPRIRYRLCDEDVARMRRGVEKLTELYWAAGARTVLQPVAGVAPLHDGDLGPLARARPLEARDLALMAFHPLGTARADRDPAAGVVDEDLKLHGLDGLYVSDASVIPSSLGVNPQITIMALAHRLGRHLLGRPSLGRARAEGRHEGLDHHGVELRVGAAAQLRERVRAGRRAGGRRARRSSPPRSRRRRRSGWGGGSPRPRGRRDNPDRLRARGSSARSSRRGGAPERDGACSPRSACAGA